MILQKKSWLSRHIITEHHAHMDALGRGILVGAVIFLVMSLGVLYYQNSGASIAITLERTGPIMLAKPAEFIVHVKNNGRSLRSGIQLTFTATPGLSFAVQDPRYDAGDNAVAISILDHDTETTVPVTLVAQSPGVYSLVASMRKQQDNAMLTETKEDIIVETPALHVVVKPQYFSAEGEQLGRGPLPPRPGETTRYFISVFAPYDGDSWRDIEMSATLGEHAIWTGFVPTDGKMVRYDASARRVLWTVDQWPPVGSVEIPTDLGVTFELALTPTEDDAGTAVRLLGPVSLNAVHGASGMRYSTTLPPVLSDPVIK